MSGFCEEAQTVGKCPEQQSGFLNDNKNAHLNQGLEVHARAAADQPTQYKLKTTPRASCFGFGRRKKQEESPKPESPKSAHYARQSYRETTTPGKSAGHLGAVKPSHTCGAGAILQSFTQDIPSLFKETKRESFASHKVRHEDSMSPAKLEHHPANDRVESEKAVVNPKIMASYDDFSLASQTHCDQKGHVLSQSGESTHALESRYQDDGADSIVEDEGYDTFGIPKWTVDPHDIFFISRGDGSQKVCRLGKGDYGPVYLGVWQDQEVAVRLARQAPISLKNERQFQANIAKLHSLNHPNIVAFLGACCWKSGKRSVVVTEFMDKSDLRMLLGRPDLASKFAWREHGQTVALDVAHGLAYLHGLGIAHGRLKTTNILMNKAGVAKLTDVALSSLLHHCKATSTLEKSIKPVPAHDGSTELISGHHLLESDGTLPGDIQAFGVVMHELLTQEKPLHMPLRPIRTPFEAPARIAYLVECCLDADPTQRPTINHIISIIAGK